MDPLTHCLLGAVTTQTFFGRRLGRLAPIVGAAAGLLPDIDRLLLLPASTVTAWTYQQQFTHTLWFIPLGGLLAMLPFFWLKQLRYRRRALYSACVASYAMHCLFDVISIQGTAIFWPVSSTHFALDWLPYFDPVLVLLLLAGMIAAIIRTEPKVGRIAFIVPMFYAGIGAAQHERAMGVQEQIVEARMHVHVARRVIPTQNNLIVWRSLYLMQSQIQTDAIRVPLFGGKPDYRQGEWSRNFAITQLPKTLRESEQLTQAQRFVNLTSQWAAFAPGQSGVKSPLLDLRSAASPEGFDAYTGIQLNDESPDEPAQWVMLSPSDPTPWADRWRDLTSPTGPAFKETSLPKRFADPSSANDNADHPPVSKAFAPLPVAQDR